MFIKQNNSTLQPKNISSEPFKTSLLSGRPSWLQIESWVLNLRNHINTEYLSIEQGTC